MYLKGHENIFIILKKTFYKYKMYFILDNMNYFDGKYI